MSSPPKPGQVDAASGGTPSQLAEAKALCALGERLRQARETCGLGSADLAERLRIGVEQLEALETADRDRLPERVFVIAQARRVAGALQIDISPELEVLRSSAHQQPPGRGDRLSQPQTGRPGGPVAAPRSAPASLAADRAAGAAGRPPLLLYAGGLLLVLAALWGVWKVRDVLQPSRQNGPSPASRLTPAPAPAEAPGAPASTGATDNGSSTAGGSGTATGGPGPAGSAEPLAGSVVLASSPPSWVEIRRPDGSIVFRGLLRGARVFSLDKGLQVLAGRPDLVTVRSGKAPPQMLGTISDVRWRSLPAVR